MENTIQIPRPLRIVFQKKFDRNKVVRNAINIKEVDDFH